MKYIRTKYGILKVIKEDEEKYIVYDDGEMVGVELKEWVIKTADTIEDLIMHDDLVEHDNINYSRIEKIRGDYFVGYDLCVIQKDRITALYIAHGEDVQCDVERWVYVARKEENGEWELV